MICKTDIVENVFSVHLRKLHNIVAEDYTLQYLYGGVNPLCKCGCGSPTPLSGDCKYKFNEYIHNHHKPTLGREISESTRKLLAGKTEKINVIQSLIIGLN